MRSLSFVGAGVMAETMIAGLCAEGFDPQHILATHHRAARLAELEARHGVRTSTQNADALDAALVVLAVKPQSLPKVLPELRPVPADGTILSIVAGARVDSLASALGHPRVVRSMPNLPCRIRQGMSVWYAPPAVDSAALEQVRRVLAVMGAELRVDDEAHVDRATAVSGTGPAIVAHFVKAYLEAAAYVGEPRGLARESVLATLVGTAEMIRRSDGHVAELIDEVTSPGGTTTRALQVLKDGRFSAVLTEAVEAAYERSRELGDRLHAQIGGG